MTSLHADHRFDLEKSGWSAQTVESSEIYSVPPAGIDRILGIGKNGVCSLMAIPYPGTDFTRYKLFPPSKLSSNDEKPRKYHQAPGSPARLYRPVGFDSGAEIIRITEGEKKAGKGTQEGLNVAGLGGIWNFATKDEQGNNTLIDDLEGISWKGKTVELIPDGDFQFKEGVRHATYRLGLMLEQRGATVKIVRLPADQKLDDYLCSNSVEDFHRLERLTLEDPSFGLQAVKEQGLKYAIRQSMVGLQDIADMKLPPQQLIMKPWLKLRTLAMIYSKRGVGKTMLATSIALAAAHKGAIGPWVVENPVPVLYLDGEMTTEQMQERISKLRKGLPPQLAPIHFLYNDHMARNGFPTINLANKEHREALEEVLREGSYGLLAIDNLASLTPGIDENAKKDYDEINQWLLNLKFQGISVLLVHHAGKGGDQRGTGGREDNLDVVIRLSHPQGYQAEDGCKFTVDFTKGRSIYGADAASFSLQLTEIDGGLVWTYAETSKKELIVAMLGQEIPQKRIHKIIGCDKSLVTKAKQWAINCGLLEDDGGFTDEGRTRFGGIDVERYLVGC